MALRVYSRVDLLLSPVVDNMPSCAGICIDGITDESGDNACYRDEQFLETSMSDCERTTPELFPTGRRRICIEHKLYV